MKLFILLILPALIHGQNGDGYMAGFVNGLRANLAVKSPCFQAITLTEDYYGYFATEVKQHPTYITAELHSFKHLVNQFTSSCYTCKLQSLINNIDLFWLSVVDYYNGKYDNYATYLITSLPTLIKYYDAFESATTDYNKGFYVGKMFSVVFRYTI